MVEGEVKIVATEGNPDHPINKGSLCAKGAALAQIPNAENRLKRVQKRNPYTDTWEEITYDQAIQEVAEKWKEIREANFEETEGSVTVNRNQAIGLLGGAALDSEECYLMQKLFRTMGTVYLEHQARI